VPYLKAKLDDFYEIHSGGAIRYFSTNALPTRPPAEATRRQKFIFYLKRYFRMVYPYANAGWYLAILGWHLRYLFGKTDCHNPLFKIMGLRLRRLGPHDNVPHFISKDLTIAPTSCTSRYSGQHLPITLPRDLPTNKTLASPRLISKPNPPHLNIPPQVPRMVVFLLVSPPPQTINNPIPRSPRPGSSPHHHPPRRNLPALQVGNHQPHRRAGKRLRLLL
jgi:hypothetical protein